LLRAGFSTPPTEPDMQGFQAIRLSKACPSSRKSPSGSYPFDFGFQCPNFIRLRPSTLRDDSPLVPFALWTAFPSSDYYGTTDAAHVSLPDCWEHPFQGSLSRS